MRISSDRQTRAFWRWLWRGVCSLVNRIAGLVTAAVVLTAIGLGALRAESTSSLVALACLTALLLARLTARARRDLATPAPAFGDFELGTLFVVATFAIIEVAGGPHGLLYPLVYALVGFLVASHAWALTAYFLMLILGIETLLTWRSGEVADWRLLVSHASFNLLFAVLSALFLRTELLSRRRRTERETRAYLDDINTQAREYRLTSGLSHAGRDSSVEEITQRRHLGSVQAISVSLYNLLGVAEKALSPHTVALLWLDASERFVRIKELRSQSDRVTEKPMAVGEGFCGVLAKRREPLVLTNLKPGHTGLVYYERPQPVTDFLGVPVTEGSFLRGMLIADRTSGKPFDESDVAVMTTLAGEIVRAIDVERVFAEMDRDKFQQERFYEASREFNQALTVRDVAQSAIGAVKRVTRAPFAALAVLLEGNKHICLEAIDWVDHAEAAAWVGQEIDAEHSLVGASIKARHPLPHGTAHSPNQAVFGPGIELTLSAVKVVPLIARGNGAGALVLASNREDFLSLGTLEMVKVIADHAAIALANAQLYEHNERLATTDGLTGLVNHRHFQYMFDQNLAQAERYGRKLSVVLTDIDHFKSVNDTYGHPVGDKVLQRIAAIVAQTARLKIDTVARYGGEEFAVLLPETDKQGAWRLAERIRTAVADEQFYCEVGRFRSSLSLGIATYPDDATIKPKLIDCADQALYLAKHEGRNRSITFDMLKSRREVSNHA